MRSFYYNSLVAGKKMYDDALNCFRSRGRSFPAASVDDCAHLVVSVLCDYPEIFYVGQEFRMTSGFMRREITPFYLYSPAETERIAAELNRKAEEITGEYINDHQSEYDKVRVLHDYLKNTIEYDYSAVNAVRPNERNMAEAHNVVGALLRGKCVCEGFAKAMKFLCDKIGLECWVVTGKGNSSVGSGPHAWNIVKINGYYHHVDVTWDNQYADSSEIPNYGYMNLSDEEMAKDHTWNRKQYPPCPESLYNYFKVNNALVDAKNQLENMLYNCFMAEEEIIMFRVVRGSSLEREINGALHEILQRAAGRCKYISVTNYKYGGIPEQLTFFIKPEYSLR